MTPGGDREQTPRKGRARLVGSAVAGVSELALFHPVDTVTKRLMSTETRVLALGSPAQTAANLNVAVFRGAAEGGLGAKAGSLFPGLGFGAAYKVLQRVYKFGGQPVVLDALARRYGDDVEERFGRKTGRTLLAAVSGSVIGIGEVVLLPLDSLKVKAQTSPEQLRGRGVVDIFRKEGFGLYRGAGLTAMRNAPGSFALFGGSAAAKASMGVGDDGHRATWAQDALASCAGAVASITVAQPLDVIKTRVQSQPFDAPEPGTAILGRLLRREGAGGLFKGLTPKLLVVGPKLIFSFTVAQHLIGYFEHALK